MVGTSHHEVLTRRELKKPEMCNFIEINDYLRAAHDVTLLSGGRTFPRVTGGGWQVAGRRVAGGGSGRKK